MSNRPLVVLGCGFIGSRVARAALAAGRQVRVASRSPAKLAPLAALGAEVVHLDAAKPRQFGIALQGLKHASVLYSIPPVTELPGGEALRRATMAAINTGANCFIYLSSAGVYGDRPDDDWVDETHQFVLDDAAMQGYHSEEAAVETGGMAGLRTIVFRLAAVYGPGRGVRNRLRKADYKLLDEGAHWISRIHVDDLVGLIFAAEERGPQNSLYNVCDDKPTTQLEHVTWIAKRLGVPVPASIASFAPGMKRQVHRGRRLRNDKLKADLGYVFKYPTYVEGEIALEAEEAGQTETPVAMPPPVAAAPVVATPVAPTGAAPTPTAPPPAPAVAPIIVVTAPERPPFIRHISTLPSSTWRYTDSPEELCVGTALAAPFGLTRLGANFVVLPPGRRTSFPHAHQKEEELAYVLEGTPDAWIDGRLYRLAPGDVVAWPAGTGIAHTIINNTSANAKLFAVGLELDDEKIVYPVDPARQAQLKPERRWEDAPKIERGPHDGLPDARRGKKLL